MSNTSATVTCIHCSLLLFLISDFDTTSLIKQHTQDIMSSSIDASETGSAIKVLETHNYHNWSDLMLSYLLEHNLEGS